MSIAQKISLSIMVISAVLWVFLLLIADEEDIILFNRVCKVSAVIWAVFGLALIVFVLGFIW